MTRAFENNRRLAIFISVDPLEKGAVSALKRVFHGGSSGANRTIPDEYNRTLESSVLQATSSSLEIEQRHIFHTFLSLSLSLSFSLSREIAPVIYLASISSLSYSRFGTSLFEMSGLLPLKTELVTRTNRPIIRTARSFCIDSNSNEPPPPCN